MSKSKSSYSSDVCACGCRNSSRHQGLGADETTNKAAESTKTDLVKTAKDYINDDIPLKYKIGAVAVGLGYVYLRAKYKK